MEWTSLTFGMTTVVSKQLPVSGSAICLGTIRVLTFGMRADIVEEASEHKRYLHVGSTGLSK